MTDSRGRLKRPPGWLRDPPTPDEAVGAFAAFGLAIYQSQCLEMEMAHYLAFVSAPAGAHRDAVDELIRLKYAQTFGQSASELAPLIEGTRPALAAEILALALVRDRLAHRYFREMAPVFPHRGGPTRMADELRAYAERFDRADRELVELTWRTPLGRNCTTERYRRALGDVLAKRKPLIEPAALPKQVRLERIRLWHGTVADASVRTPVFESDHGRLIIGPLGLCRAVSDFVDGSWTSANYPESALPSSVNPRGRARSPGEYLITLAGGWALRVRHTALEGGRHYRFSFVRQRPNRYWSESRTRSAC